MEETTILGAVNRIQPAQSIEQDGLGSMTKMIDTAPGRQAAPGEARLFWQVHGLMIYYAVLLFLTLWFLLDVWSENFYAVRLLVSFSKEKEPALAMACYALSGAIIGSILYQIRTLYTYYVKKKSYDYRWIGKYVTAPLESAAMAVVVLALIRGGVGIFGGGTVTSTNDYAIFATGALVGFGMRDVVRWIGNIVRSVFVTDSSVLPRESEGSQQGEPQQG
jgi:hypothetical protein